MREAKEVASAAAWCLAGVLPAFFAAVLVVTAIGLGDQLATAAVLAAAAGGVAAGSAVFARRNPTDPVFVALAGVLVLDVAALGMGGLSGGRIVDGTVPFLLQQAVFFGSAAAGALVVQARGS